MTVPQSYSLPQIRLHWIVAALIAWQFLLNEPIGAAWRAYEKHGLPLTYSPLAVAHIAVGVLVLALVVWRLVLRSKRGVPALPENEPRLMKLSAHLAHWLLYGLMGLMTLSGLIMWFGGNMVAGDLHDLSQGALLILIALHVAAVAVHQFVLKTNLIARMKLSRK